MRRASQHGPVVCADQSNMDWPPHSWADRRLAPSDSPAWPTRVVGESGGIARHRFLCYTLSRESRVASRELRVAAHDPWLASREPRVAIAECGSRPTLPLDAMRTAGSSWRIPSTSTGALLVRVPCRFSIQPTTPTCIRGPTLDDCVVIIAPRFLDHWIVSPI